MSPLPHVAFVPPACVTARRRHLPFSRSRDLLTRAADGYITSFFSSIQLVGSLLSGWLLDRYGCRRVLALSFAASAASYALVASATSVQALYLAKLPTVFQHAVLAARAFVSYSTSDELRSVYIGYVGVAYGVGMLVGPTLGGQLARFSLQHAAAVATAGSLLSLGLVLAFVPEVTKTSHDNAAASKREDASPNPAAAAVEPTVPAAAGTAKGGGEPGMAALLCVKALLSLAAAFFHSTFGLAAAERFGLDPAGTGYLMSTVGGVAALSQLFGVAAAKRVASERTITITCAAALSICFFVFSRTVSLVDLYMVVVPLCVVSTIFNVTNTAQLTRASPAGSKGTVVAVDMALGSAARMVAPTAGAYLLTNVGFWSVGATSGALVAMAMLMMMVGRRAGAALSVPHHSFCRSADAWTCG
jgi:OCT family organic cation transporter-like MFS transporter 18